MTNRKKMTIEDLMSNLEKEGITFIKEKNPYGKIRHASMMMGKYKRIEIVEKKRRISGELLLFLKRFFRIR